MSRVDDTHDRVGVFLLLPHFKRQQEARRQRHVEDSEDGDDGTNAGKVKQFQFLTRTRHTGQER
jgi:hypothetical protein